MKQELLSLFDALKGHPKRNVLLDLFYAYYVMSWVVKGKAAISHLTLGGQGQGWNPAGGLEGHKVIAWANYIEEKHLGLLQGNQFAQEALQAAQRFISEGQYAVAKAEEEIAGQPHATAPSAMEWSVALRGKYIAALAMRWRFVERFAQILGIGISDLVGADQRPRIAQASGLTRQDRDAWKDIRIFNQGEGAALAILRAMFDGSEPFKDVPYVGATDPCSYSPCTSCPDMDGYAGLNLMFESCHFPLDSGGLPSPLETLRVMTNWRNNRIVRIAVSADDEYELEKVKPTDPMYRVQLFFRPAAMTHAVQAVLRTMPTAGTPTNGATPPPQQQCPEGWSGTYPNCISPEGTTRICDSIWTCWQDPVTQRLALSPNTCDAENYRKRNWMQVDPRVCMDVPCPSGYKKQSDGTCKKVEEGPDIGGIVKGFEWGRWGAWIVIGMGVLVYLWLFGNPLKRGPGRPRKEQ